MVQSSLKSKTKKSQKFLSSSGIRNAKFIYADNFSAQLRPSFLKPVHFDFRVMTMRDKEPATITFENKKMYYNFKRGSHISFGWFSWGCSIVYTYLVIWKSCLCKCRSICAVHTDNQRPR